MTTPEMREQEALGFLATEYELSGGGYGKAKADELRQGNVRASDNYAIRAIIAAQDVERQRCIRIAENHSNWNRSNGYRTATCIAAGIRNGDTT